MLDTKKMIQDGFTKSQIALVITKDRNGKEHIIAVDTVNNAKKYGEAETIRLCTYYVQK